MSSQNNPHNYVLIMAGGAGTRLWPLSRRENPKQFQSFVGEQTMLQHAVALVRQVVPIENTFIMAVPKFSGIISQQIHDLPSENLLFEPAQKDNGPAALLGMLQIHQRDPQAKVAIFWSDHLVQNAAGFEQMLRSCFAAAEAHPKSLITVGVNPTHADTGFGYIQMGKEVGNYEDLSAFTVKRFVEKPDLATATTFVNSWDYLWNVGYKVMSSTEFLQQFKAVQPDLKDTLAALSAACEKDDKEAMAAAYEELPKLSIEYLFTQYLSDLLVIPADLGWSDLGSWNILHDILKKQHPDEMVIKGEAILVNSRGSLVFAKDRPIALIGVEDLIVVDDGDVIMVMHKDQAQSIKTLTKELEEKQSPLL